MGLAQDDMGLAQDDMDLAQNVTIIFFYSIFLGTVVPEIHFFQYEYRGKFFDHRRKVQAYPASRKGRYEQGIPGRGSSASHEVGS